MMALALFPVCYVIGATAYRCGGRDEKQIEKDGYGWGKRQIHTTIKTLDTLEGPHMAKKQAIIHEYMSWQ